MTESNRPKLTLVPKATRNTFVTALVVPSESLRDDPVMNDGALQATFLSLAFANAFPSLQEQAMTFNQGGMFTADAISMRSPWVADHSDYVVMLRKSTSMLKAEHLNTPIDLTVYSVIFVGQNKEEVQDRVSTYSQSHGVIIPKVLSMFVGEHAGVEFHVIASDMPMELVETCILLTNQFNYETRLENIKVVK